MITVDCIEFYTERLVSIYISQQINSLLQKAAKKVNYSIVGVDRKKEMPPTMRKPFNFKICKSIDMLYENLKVLDKRSQKVKRKIAVA